MITLSGRTLSRAWLAVQLASSDDAARPVLYRSVHIEEFDTGVRLIATDSYWMSICWAPALQSNPFAEPHAKPGLFAVPVASATLNDDEWRVRDLFRHVAKVTKKPDNPDVIVHLDLETSSYDEAVPTLSPDLAAVRARVEIPGEQIQVRTCEIPFPDWRFLLRQFDGQPVGKLESTFSAWMLDRFSKVPKIVGADVITMTWLAGHKARWQIDAEQVLCRPRGVFMDVRRVKGTDDGLTDDPTDPDAPAPPRPLALVPSGDDE
jgi:hypothetical protein